MKPSARNSSSASSKSVQGAHSKRTPTGKWPKLVRLLRQPQFAKVHRSGLRLSSRFFKFYVLENGLDCPRFGITVSKKVDKRAVVRNRIKRLIREVLRVLRAELVANYDIVIIAREGSVLGGSTSDSGKAKKRNIAEQVNSEKGEKSIEQYSLTEVRRQIAGTFKFHGLLVERGTKRSSANTSAKNSPARV